MLDIAELFKYATCVSSNLGQRAMSTVALLGYNRLGVLENRVLTKIFRPKRENVTDKVKELSLCTP